MRRTWIQLTLVAAICAAGCGKKDTRPDPEPVEQAQGGDPVNLDAVDSAVLGDAPCGNPDWSQLPPGSEPATP